MTDLTKNQWCTEVNEMPYKKPHGLTDHSGNVVSFLKDNSTMTNRNVISVTLKSKTESIDGLIRKATEALSSTKKFDEENQKALEWIK